MDFLDLVFTELNAPRQDGPEVDPIGKNLSQFSRLLWQEVMGSASLWDHKQAGI